MESGKRKKSTCGSGLGAAAKASKKTKKQKALSPPPVTVLDDAVLSLVGEFLNARDLLNFATCCKTFTDPKYLNYNVVIRSASFTGGHPKTKLDNIISCIRERSIWTPSPLRLLRFVNGRRCEKCVMERRKNIRNTNVVHYNFGVYYCLDCAKPTHTNGCSKKVLCNKKWMPFISHQRVAPFTTSGGNTYITVFKSPAVDISGNPIGPLITVQDIETIMNNNGNGSSSIDQFLEAIDQKDPYAKHWDKIIEIYDKFVNDAQDREDKRRQQAKDRLEAKIDAIGKKSAEIVDALSDLVGDVPWKEDLLQFTMKPVSWGAKTLRATFECSTVDNILEPIMKAPASKGTISNLQAAAKKLCSVFRSVSLKPEFLSQLQDDDPFKNIFLEIYQNSPSRDWLHWLDSKDVKRLEEGCLLQVMLEQGFGDFGRRVQRSVRYALESSVGFARGDVVPRINDESSDEDSDDYRDEEETQEDSEYHGMTKRLRKLLAESMWEEIQVEGKNGDWRKRFSNDTTVLDLSQHYHRCMGEFPTIYRAAIEFFAHPKYRISRQRKISIWSLEYCVAKHIAALRSRNFRKISKGY